MTVVDGADARLARRATGILRDFNIAGVLNAADVHVARRLGALTGETDEVVLLNTGSGLIYPQTVPITGVPVLAADAELVLD